MSKFSRRSGKIVKSYIEFDYDLFIATHHRNYIMLGSELRRLKKELKGLPEFRKSKRVREIETRMAEIDHLYMLQKELKRQFSLTWYTVVDGQMVRFGRKDLARLSAGLPPASEEPEPFEEEKPKTRGEHLVEKGTTVKTSTPAARDYASTIGSDGTLYKVCNTCGVEKPYSDFNFHPCGDSLRQMKCKLCASEYSMGKYREKRAEMVEG